MLRVGIRPFVYQGIAGYRVRWSEDGRIHSYFVQTRADAKYVKQRAKAGKDPRQRCWAVKV